MFAETDLKDDAFKGNEIICIYFFLKKLLKKEFLKTNNNK